MPLGFSLDSLLSSAPVSIVTASTTSLIYCLKRHLLLCPFLPLCPPSPRCLGLSVFPVPQSVSRSLDTNQKSFTFKRRINTTFTCLSFTLHLPLLIFIFTLIASINTPLSRTDTLSLPWTDRSIVQLKIDGAHLFIKSPLTCGLQRGTKAC